MSENRPDDVEWTENPSGEGEDVRSGSETLDDLVPADLLEHVADAVKRFPELDLPYEAEVYQAGEINRTNLSRCEGARIKSETLHGTAYVETEEEERDDGLYVTIRVLDPENVVVDPETGEVVDRGEQ